jgi:hypothetical protein
MKLFVSIILLTISILFPEIKPNATEEDKSKSIIYNLFNGKKDFLIAYSTESYWSSNKKDYQILACKNGKWEKIFVHSKKKKNGNWSMSSLSYKSINSEKVNQLLSKFNNLSFWELENEKLNQTKEKNENGEVIKYSISDGVNYRFEILQGSNLRTIESYEPEYFLEKMPKIQERETFIKCLKEIEIIFGK